MTGSTGPMPAGDGGEAAQPLEGLAVAPRVGGNGVAVALGRAGEHVHDDEEDAEGDDDAPAEGHRVQGLDAVLGLFGEQPSGLVEEPADEVGTGEQDRPEEQHDGGRPGRPLGQHDAEDLRRPVVDRPGDADQAGQRGRSGRRSSRPSCR